METCVMILEKKFFKYYQCGILKSLFPFFVAYFAFSQPFKYFILNGKIKIDTYQSSDHLDSLPHRQM